MATIIRSAADGMICAFRITPGQPPQEVTIEELKAGLRQERGFVWLHVNSSLETGRKLVRQLPELPAEITEELLDSSEQLHFFQTEQGCLLSLGDILYESDPDNQRVSLLRVWLEPHRVVSARRHPLTAVDVIRRRIVSGHTPDSSAALLIELLEALANTFAPVAARLSGDADAVEDRLLAEQINDLHGLLGGLRRRAVYLLRQIEPQQRLLARLQSRPPPWFDEDDRRHLAETIAEIGEVAALIQSTQERAKAMQDELTAMLTEQTNKNLYILSVVSVIILPMTLLSGMFGMNVGGIPGLERPLAFWVVSGLIFLVGVAAYVVLKWRHWF
jgi:zinc transporter